MVTTKTYNGVRIAVEGCGHGTLNAIYSAVARSCKERRWDKVDLLIIGGDFQAVRNSRDLSVMAVPVKYRQLGDFPDYYKGTRKAPYPTIFIGGNHEANAHLWELFYGGWVAPNMYYMGAANVMRFGPLRIAAMSGIWKGYDYQKPHFERLPFGPDDIRSFYHVREIDVRKLLLLRTQVDIGLSHDWPRGIEKHGNSDDLFRRKPFFRKESMEGTLGNPAAAYVLDRLRPQYWFSAHLHTKFSAIKTFSEQDEPAQMNSGAKSQDMSQSTAQARQVNPDEIDLGLDEDDGTPSQPNEETMADRQDDADSRPLETCQSTAQAPQANPDEIDLDLNDNDGTAAQPDEEATEDENENKDENEDEDEDAGPVDHTESNKVSDELLSQLPASFTQPSEQSSEQPSEQPRQIPGQPVPPGITNKVVRFLSLDKCLPRRNFLQLCQVIPFGLDKKKHGKSPTNPATHCYQLEYDPEWLAITRVFHDKLSIGGGNSTAKVPPSLGEEAYLPLIDEQRVWVEEHIVKPGKLVVPNNFQQTAQPDKKPNYRDKFTQPAEYTNPQTAEFCDLLCLENLWDSSPEERREREKLKPAPSSMKSGPRGGNKGSDGGRGKRGKR